MADDAPYEQIVSVEELGAKLPFVMDEDDKREAELTLDTLSDDARDLGSPRWDAHNAPRQVRNIILRAANRHMKNYESYTMSRAGDESVSWTDRGDEAGTAYFTERESSAIRKLAGNRNSGFWSVGLYAYNDPQVKKEVGYASTLDSGEDFPYFADGTGRL